LSNYEQGTYSTIGFSSDNATNQPLEVNLLGPPLILKKTALNMKLRKDSSNDVVVYSEVSKSNYILKG
jgi:hypothetical protein